MIDFVRFHIATGQGRCRNKDFAISAVTDVALQIWVVKCELIIPSHKSC
jgi:hypothetical protein